MKNSKESKGIMDGETSSSSNTSGTTSSKKAKKVTYEKHLEEIMKELQAKSGGSSGAKGVKKQKLKPEQEIVLLEQKCVLLLKLKRNKDVVDDGYSIIGRMGPNVTVYKCILIALVRLGKAEDDFLELLEAWKKATPKCPDMLEVKRKFDGYNAALRSGLKHCDIFSGIEDTLSLNADAILSKLPADAVACEEKKWRYRAPPPRHTTFSLCPRASPNNSCIYGNDCLFAHSPEELKEWKLRTDMEKKNNNNLTEEMTLEETNVAKKKTMIPSIYRSLLIPPLCIHYLLDLGKKIKEAVDIKEILTDEISGVKLKVETPLGYRKRADGMSKVQCTWSFAITSKTPLGTVSILHDANRDCFRISSGHYFNKKKENIGLIELHPNNKVQTMLQVLNTFIQPSLFLRFNSGWPDVCYYKVEVAFESRDPFPEPGLYRQSIVFDFKRDPKVVKHISIEVMPKVEPIGNHLTESGGSSTKLMSPWGVTNSSNLTRVEASDAFSNLSYGESSILYPQYNGGETLDHQPVEFSSNISDFPSLTQFSKEKDDFPTIRNLSNKDLDLVDSESGKILRLKGFPFSGLDERETEFFGANNLFSDNVPLTKDNYRTWMRDFLEVEFMSRQKAVNKLKKTMNVRVSTAHMVNPEYMYRHLFTGSLYGDIELMSEISCDQRLKRLINCICHSVVITVGSDVPSPFSLRKPSRRYLCKIMCKSKSVLCIGIGGTVREDLQLLPDSIEPLQVQFILDAYYFDKMKFTLESLSSFHLEILFPDFQNSKLPFLKVMDTIGLLHEEELLLNNRQMSVYNLVTGRKVLIDGDIFTPPVLVTGGVSTGKTYLLAHCIRGILRSNVNLQPPRILVCTHSDFSADAYIIDYLHQWLINDQLSVQRSKPLRVYDKNRFVDNVSGAVKHYCVFDEGGLSFRFPTREEVLSHRIIISTFSTCSELIQLGLEDDTFSHVIIDEATNCLEVECVMPIILAGKNSKIVLAGDVMQSQINVFSSSRGVPPISLLERLRNMYPFRHPFVINLIENYANHEVICKFISKEFYHDQLKAVVNHPIHPTYYPLNFHHIPTSREMQPDNGGGSYNLDEIRHVVDFTEELVRTWPETWGSAEHKHSIVILTPYTNHINGLRVQLQVKGLKAVNVELASNLQGSKYRVVIISTVRTYKDSMTNPVDDIGDGGFFSDRRVFCAALCAAKSVVVAFGDAHSLWSHGSCRDLWQKYITECQQHQSLKDVKAQSTQPEKAEESKSDTYLPTLNAKERVRTLNFNGFKSPLRTNQTLNSHPFSQPSTSYVEDRFSAGDNGSARLISSSHVISGPACPKNQQVLIIPPSSDTISSSKDADNPWNLNAAFSDAPKTDLFSAFSSSETLYGSKSPTTLTQEKEKVNQRQGNSQLLTYSDGSCNISLSDAIVSFTVMGQNKLVNTQNFTSPNEKFSAVGGKGLIRDNVIRKAEPLDFSTFGMKPQELETFKVSDGTEESLKSSSDLNIIEPMPLPIPTIPSRVLFDQKFLIDGGPNSAAKTFDSNRNQFEIGNGLPIPTPRNFSPLTTPPGFTPITTPPIPTKYRNFSPLDETLSFPGSPSRNGGVSSKFMHKKSSYELPPRMLKNLQLASTNRSPLKKPIVVKTPPLEMNFFEELGLGSQTTVSQEASRSVSSASSDHSLDFEEVNNEEEDGDDCSNITTCDDWIEVKSSRKGRSQTGKKVKTKSKRVSCVDDELASVSIKNSEMCVDDKVEVITQMGFSKNQAIKALQACEKDLQRAVDWLISKPTKST